MSVHTGATLYERSYGNRYFVAAMSLIIILLATAYVSERLDRELSRAETAQFHLRLAELNSAVILMQASRVAKDDIHSSVRYADSNPMEWFEEQSAAHYLGEMSLSDARVISGNWVYDPVLASIAYLPKSVGVDELKNGIANRRQPSTDGHKKHPQWLRFKVVGLLSKDENYSVKKNYTGFELRLID